MKRFIEKFFTKEIIMYLIFGVLTTVVALAVYYGLTYTILNPDSSWQLQVANIISWIAGLIFAYITNRKYVFESKNTNKLEEVSKFTSARLITLLLDMIIMYVGVTRLNFNDKIIKIISQIVVIISNYIFSKLIVFKNKG